MSPQDLDGYKPCAACLRAQAKGWEFCARHDFEAYGVKRDKPEETPRKSTRKGRKP